MAPTSKNWSNALSTSTYHPLFRPYVPHSFYVVELPLHLPDLFPFPCILIRSLLAPLRERICSMLHLTSQSILRVYRIQKTLPKYFCLEVHIVYKGLSQTVLVTSSENLPALSTTQPIHTNVQCCLSFESPIPHFSFSTASDLRYRGYHRHIWGMDCKLIARWI